MEFVEHFQGESGCCAYGLFGNEVLDEKVSKEKENDSYPKLWSKPLSPYCGPMPSKMEIRKTIKAAFPWLQVDPIKNDDCYP
eukprot:7001669-Ditylum_brightwellii.AAC.1